MVGVYYFAYFTALIVCCIKALAGAGAPLLAGAAAGTVAGTVAGAGAAIGVALAGAGAGFGAAGAGAPFSIIPSSCIFFNSASYSANSEGSLSFSLVDKLTGPL